MRIKLLYKRAFDVAMLLTAHVILAPLWAMLWIGIPLAIFIDSGMPVFYRQERMGKGGKPFMALKFRTMVRNADAVGPAWTAPDDARITRVGRVLRPTALDELPQIINILLGDMSFVGPRALAQSELEELAPHHAQIMERFAVPAGLTGLAQLYAPRDDMTEKLRRDLEYIHRLSLGLDISIMIRSVFRTIRGRWDKSHAQKQPMTEEKRL